MMAPSCATNSKSHSTRTTFGPALTPIFAALFLISSVIVPAAVAVSDSRLPVNQTFRAAEQLRRLKRVNAHLKKINKPAVKTIQAIMLNSKIPLSTFLDLSEL